MYRILLKRCNRCLSASFMPVSVDNNVTEAVHMSTKTCDLSLFTLTSLTIGLSTQLLTVYNNHVLHAVSMKMLKLLPTNCTIRLYFTARNIFGEQVTTIQNATSKELCIYTVNHKKVAEHL